MKGWLSLPRSFARLFTAVPANEDGQEARQRRLLNLVLAGLAIPGTLFGLAMLVLWLAGRTPAAGALAGLGIQPFYLLSYWLGTRGRHRLAAAIPVAALLLVMTGGAFQLGVGHVTYVGFAMAALTAGILIGSRAGLLVAALSTLANLAAGSLHAAGRLPAALDPTSTVLADSIGLGLGLSVLIAFTGIYGRELKKALLTQQALSAELQVSGANLELQVRRRTRDLQRRVNQIRTAAEISRAISGFLDPETLLQQVVDLIQQRFGLYYAGVFLVEEQRLWPQPGVGDTGGLVRRFAVLRAGSGSAGQKMLAEGHKLPIPAADSQPLSAPESAASGSESAASGSESAATAPGSFPGPQTQPPGPPSSPANPLRSTPAAVSMVGWAIAHRQPRIAIDIEDEEHPGTVVSPSGALITRFHNPHLPLTRSELALPILTGGGDSSSGSPSPGRSPSSGHPPSGRNPSSGRCLGALSIQSEAANAFDGDDITILQAIADSLGIALENARLYQQSQASLAEIRTLHRQYISRAWKDYTGLSAPGDDALGVAALESDAQAPPVPGAAVPGAPPASTVFETPLLLRDQVIGALAIEGGPGPLTPDEIALVESIASETAIALENARLLEETQRRALREHQVTEITGRLRLSNHPQDILRTAIHELRQALSASAVRFKQLPDEVRPETRPEDRHDVQLENDE